MAPTYKSSAGNVNSSTNSGAATIPTVISGDLIILFGLAIAGDGAPLLDGNDIPTGYTQYSSVPIFYKISDGTETGTTPSCGGGAQKFTGCVVVNAGTFDTTNPIGALVANAEAQGSTTKTSGSVAPITNATLGILFIGQSDDVTMSAYSGGSVTWNEVIDISNTTLGDVTLSIAYGNCTTTSSFAVTATASKSTGATRSVLMFIKDRQDFTVSEDVSLSETITTQLSLNVTVTEDITATELTTLKNGWSNDSKSTTTWVNDDKS